MARTSILVNLPSRESAPRCRGQARAVGFRESRWSAARDTAGVGTRPAPSQRDVPAPYERSAVVIVVLSTARGAQMVRLTTWRRASLISQLLLDWLAGVLNEPVSCG